MVVVAAVAGRLGRSQRSPHPTPPHPPPALSLPLIMFSAVVQAKVGACWELILASIGACVCGVVWCVVW